MSHGRVRLYTGQFVHPWWALTSGIEHVATRFANLTSNEGIYAIPYLGGRAACGLYAIYLDLAGQLQLR